MIFFKRKSFKTESKTFEKKRAFLAKNYLGKFAIVKGKIILGVFDDEVTAIITTERVHERGTFMVKEICFVDPVAHFHSRVAW